jgi:hypothetical protein
MGRWSKLSLGPCSAAAEKQSLFSQPHVFISVPHNLFCLVWQRDGKAGKTNIKGCTIPGVAWAFLLFFRRKDP